MINSDKKILFLHVVSLAVSVLLLIFDSIFFYLLISYDSIFFFSLIGNMMELKPTPSRLQYRATSTEPWALYKGENISTLYRENVYA